MIKPMLSKIGNEFVLEREGYIFEPKLDGYRAILEKTKKLKFSTRNGIDITKDYPPLDFINNLKAKTCTIDGEIVVYDRRGNPSFSLMHDKTEGYKPVYVVFDILEKNGTDLRGLPLTSRKEILKKTIIESENLQTIFYTSDGKTLFEAMKKRGVEGIVAKKIDSIYTSSRSDSWLKIKFEKTLDAIIIGYLSKKRKISSLALGLYNGKNLIHIGNVGTGFSEKKLKELQTALMKIETEKIDDIQYVKPRLICEVKYYEITPNKKLRAPIFLRIRDDKRVKECNTEQLN